MNRYANIVCSCATFALVAAAAALSAQQPAAGGRQGGRGGTTAAGSAAPAGTTVTTLGPVHIAQAVKADGQPLPAGTYQLRVTETEASPAAPGQTPQSERWAEFLQGGQVKGREVVTVVLASDIAAVGKMKPPPSGSYRAEVLKGGDYYRIWYNKGGTHYLVHFNIG